MKPSINEVLNQIDNRYYLVVTVAKRAREIIDGSAPYVAIKTKEIKPVTTAAREVADRKINFRKLTEEEIQLQEALHEAQQAQDNVEE